MIVQGKVRDTKPEKNAFKGDIRFERSVQKKGPHSAYSSYIFPGKNDLTLESRQVLISGHTLLIQKYFGHFVKKIDFASKNGQFFYFDVLK